MFKLLSLLAAYILPFIIIFWDRWNLIFVAKNNSLSLLVIGVVSILYLIWNKRMKGNMMRYKADSPVVSYYRAFNYLVVFGTLSLVVYLLTLLGMSLYMMLIVIGGCQILSEFLLIMHNTGKTKHKDEK